MLLIRNAFGCPQQTLNNRLQTQTCKDEFWEMQKAINAKKIF